MHTLQKQFSHLLPRARAQLLLSVRGGASKSSTKKSTSRSSKKKKKKSGSQSNSLHTLSKSTKKKAPLKTVTGKRALLSTTTTTTTTLLDKYSKVLPATRLYMTLCAVLTVSTLLLGDELSQSLYALTPQTFPFQIYRLVTSFSFLGPPSISSLMSIYYLYTYGTSLESLYGTADFLVFLVSQCFILSCLSKVMALPFTAPSAVTAMLHVLSRQAPKENVKWLVFTVPYWSLPLGLMASDVLQNQSAGSSVPHIVGMLSGHVHHFQRDVYPKFR